MIDFFINLGNWFIRPSVAAWAGAVAAIIAAMTIEPRTWRRRPLRAVKRAVRVALIWLIIAFLLTKWLPPGLGGKGTGGGQGDNTGSSLGNLDWNEPLLIDARLSIQFRPMVSDPSRATDFACELYFQATGRQPIRHSVEAGNMDQFAQQFRERLNHFPKTQNLAVEIVANPFPGNGVLRKLQTILQSELGDVRVEVKR